MARSIFVNGWNIPVRLADFNFIESARNGEVGTGGFDLDSENAGVTINSHWGVTALETSSGSNTNLYHGFVGDLAIARGPFAIDKDRKFDTNIVDLNTMLIDDIMSGSSANRPEETDIARVTWLVGTSFLNGMGSTIGASGATTLEAADYRTQNPLALLTQAAETAGKLFFVYWDLATAAPKLFYDLATASNFITSSKISTYLPDGSNSQTHHPRKESLHRALDGGRIYSELLYKYDGGSVTVTNTATASNYKPRKTVIYDNRTKSSAMATRKANQYLASVSTPEDVITLDVDLTATQINEFRAGQLMQIKAPHLGLPTFVDRRIVRTEKKPRIASGPNDQEDYTVTMELSVPKSNRFGASGVPTDSLPTDTSPGPDTPIPIEVTGACATGDARQYQVENDLSGPSGTLGGSSSADKVGSWVFFNVAYTDGTFPCPLGGGSWRGYQDEEIVLEYTAPVDDPTAYLGLQTVIDATSLVIAGRVFGYEVRALKGAASTVTWDNSGSFVADGVDGSPFTVTIPRNLVNWNNTNCLILRPAWLCDRPVQFCNGTGDFSNPHDDGRANSGSYDVFGFDDLCAIQLTPGSTGQATNVSGVGDVDGVNDTFTLLGWDGTGGVEASINGLPSGVTDFTLDTVGFTVTFNGPPPANSVVLFSYHAVT